MLAYSLLSLAFNDGGRGRGDNSGKESVGETHLHEHTRKGGTYFPKLEEKENRRFQPRRNGKKRKRSNRIMRKKKCDDHVGFFFSYLLLSLFYHSQHNFHQFGCLLFIQIRKGDSNWC